MKNIVNKLKVVIAIVVSAIVMFATVDSYSKGPKGGKGPKGKPGKHGKPGKRLKPDAMAKKLMELGDADNDSKLTEDELTKALKKFNKIRREKKKAKQGGDA